MQLWNISTKMTNNINFYKQQNEKHLILYKQKEETLIFTSRKHLIFTTKEKKHDLYKWKTSHSLQAILLLLLLHSTAIFLEFTILGVIFAYVTVL